MVFGDKTLTCVECNASFAFSADDQRYHLERGFSDPKRCPSCRQARRASRPQFGAGGGAAGAGGGAFGAARRMYPAVCAQCGADTEVPFQPRGDRPVYCSDCYRQQRQGSPSSASRN